ncbi:hypothetical protein IQ07DRAFT_640668 [Pyrenochaeta sp. DS3sAY3a]|nr:hypothetical protein IQ07DRAFT_640668 [Pyrenochaeta sp. DS3sAY3a]
MAAEMLNSPDAIHNEQNTKVVIAAGIYRAAVESCFQFMFDAAVLLPLVSKVNAKIASASPHGTSNFHIGGEAILLQPSYFLTTENSIPTSTFHRQRSPLNSPVAGINSPATTPTANVVFRLQTRTNMYSFFALPSSWKEYFFPKPSHSNNDLETTGKLRGCLRNPKVPSPRKSVKFNDEHLCEYIEPELPYEPQYYAIKDQGKYPDARVIAAHSFYHTLNRVSQAWSDDELADSLR